MQYEIKITVNSENDKDVIIDTLENLEEECALDDAFNVEVKPVRLPES